MDAILLAAGSSVRFGENKLFYPIDGKPMYRHALDGLYALLSEGLLENLIVVTQYLSMMQVIHAAYPSVRIVENQKPQMGISHSIFLGLTALKGISPESEACMFLVADQPYLRKQTIEGFLRTFQTCGKRIAACGHEDTIGNPVIFSKCYYEELCRLSGDRGGKQIVMRNLADTHLFDVPERELFDIDSKQRLPKEDREGKDGICMENEEDVWKDGLSYKIRLRIYKKDLVFGPGVAELMEYVEELESLSAACRRMGMAYSKGWKIVKRAEEDFGFLLMEGTRGGSHGGKMVLTEEGKEILHRYRKFEAELQQEAEKLFHKYF